MHDDELVVVVDFNPPPTAPTRRRSDSRRRDMPVNGGCGWVGKRTVDVVLSSLLLLLTAPLFLIVPAVIKLTSIGPAFYRQRRVGRSGRDFLILKFRTMYVDSEERLRSDPNLYQHFIQGGYKLSCREDPRVTAVGRVLRRLSLDELPQLLNVLQGQMSMVGPRPVVPDELQSYGIHQSVYADLRPGLTGLWQVSGRSTIPFPRRAELDCQYHRTCGPWVDARILLRTPLVVVTGRGAG